MKFFMAYVLLRIRLFVQIASGQICCSIWQPCLTYENQNKLDYDNFSLSSLVEKLLLQKNIGVFPKVLRDGFLGVGLEKKKKQLCSR
jgi:hypothetical protein